LNLLLLLNSQAFIYAETACHEDCPNSKEYLEKATAAALEAVDIYRRLGHPKLGNALQSVGTTYNGKVAADRLRSIGSLLFIIAVLFSSSLPCCSLLFIIAVLLHLSHRDCATFVYFCVQYQSHPDFIWGNATGPQHGPDGQRTIELYQQALCAYEKVQW
jgi:hypothetical protein